VWHPHDTILVPDICLTTTKCEFNISCVLYIFWSLSLGKQPKIRQTTNLLCMSSKCHMIGSWHLHLPEQMKIQHLIFLLREFYLFCCCATVWPLKQLANQVDCCKNYSPLQEKFPPFVHCHCLNWHNFLRDSLFFTIQSAKHIYILWAIIL